MILGEIGKTSPFYLQKGFIPSNSTLVVAILAVFHWQFRVGNVIWKQRCKGWMTKRLFQGGTVWSNDLEPM